MLLSKLDFFDCFSKFNGNRSAIDKCYRNLKHQQLHHYSYHHHLHRIGSKRKSITNENRHCDTMTETAIIDDNVGASNKTDNSNNISPSSSCKNTSNSSRCKRSSSMSMTSIMPLHSSSFIVAIIYFLATIHCSTVNGASTRDIYSSNSVYNNTNSINNVITANATTTTTSSNRGVDSPRVFILNDNLVSEAVDVPIDINITSKDKYESEYYSSRSNVRRTPIYQNEFAVFIPSGIDLADSIATKHGFTNMGQVSTFMLF